MIITKEIGTIGRIHICHSHSAVAQAIRAKSFAPDGAFTKLPRNEQIALVELARTTESHHR